MSKYYVSCHYELMVDFKGHTKGTRFWAGYLGHPTLLPLDNNGEIDQKAKPINISLEEVLRLIENETIIRVKEGFTNAGE
jgi:hypothetical protein